MTVWQLVEPFLKEQGFTLVILPDSQLAQVRPRAHLARDSFGNLVEIKMVPLFDTSSEEFYVLARLDRDLVRTHPHNHAVVTRDVFIFSPDFSSAGFTPHLSDRRAFVVTELQLQYRNQNPTPWSLLIQNTKVFVDFVTQLAEGVAFLHEQGIAHQNICHDSIVSQPTGFGHQWLISSYERAIHCGIHWKVLPTTRLLTTHTSSATSTFIGGRNPFAEDVRSLGLIFESVIKTLSQSTEPPCVLPGAFNVLQSQMTASDPTQRPTSEFVFREIVRIFSGSKQSVLAQGIANLTEAITNTPSLLVGGVATVAVAQRYLRR